MTVKSVVYANNLQPSLVRGPSESIWCWQGQGNAGVPDFIQDGTLGIQFFDDFECSPNFVGGAFTGGFGRWTILSTANGVITDAGIVGGGVTLSGTTVAHQGVQLSSSSGAFQVVSGTTVYQGSMAFEARVMIGTNGYANSIMDTFVGLSDNGTGATSIISTTTAGSLSTTPNLIGFHQRGGVVNATDWNFVFQLAGGTAVYPVGLQNIITAITGVAPVAGTYYKLGCIYDPNAAPLMISSASTGQVAGVIARPTLKVFVNGVAAVAFLDNVNLGGATFPTGIMGPAFAQLLAATTNCKASIDWFKVGQNSVS